jgi:hypothetical protein
MVAYTTGRCSLILRRMPYMLNCEIQHSKSVGLTSSTPSSFETLGTDWTRFCRSTTFVKKPIGIIWYALCRHWPSNQYDPPGTVPTRLHSQLNCGNHFRIRLQATWNAWAYYFRQGFALHKQFLGTHTPPYWCGVSLHRSSADHPQSDGATEQANCTITQILRVSISPEQKDWVHRLPAIEFAFNSAYSSTTGYSPFFLNFGRNPSGFVWNTSDEVLPGEKLFYIDFM